MEHIEIFLSTVSDEFRSYRGALRDLLKRPNVDIHIQEDFIPTGTETLDKLDGYVARSDAIIHLVGDMTGAWASTATLQALCARYSDLADRLPPLKAPLDSGHPPLSYTQWEAYLAVYHRKPLVIAVPAPGAPRDEKYRIEANQQASQQAHLNRLRELGHYAEITFRNPEQLALQILRSSIFDLLVRAEVVSALDDFKRLHLVSRSLSRESDRLRRAKRDRRTEMAKLFEQISGCLTSVSGEIRAGRVPHGKCFEVLKYADRLPATLKEELGEDEANRLGHVLLSAHNVEGVAVHLPDALPEKEPYLKEIDEAAGEFQALANLVRVG